MLHEQRNRAESFGAVAEQYDRARPSYPSALIDELLADGARSVLDVGCGTGIASVLFKERGLSVLGIEVDARMADVARAKGIDVEVGKFEDWERAGRSFELLSAGQSWHWVDPLLGAERAAEALLPKGRIGLFWNFGGPSAELQERFDRVYAELGPKRDIPLERSTHGEATLAGLRDSGAFGEPEVSSFPWSTRYDTASWLDQAATQSDPRRCRASS